MQQFTRFREGFALPQTEQEKRFFAIQHAPQDCVEISLRKP